MTSNTLTLEEVAQGLDRPVDYLHMKLNPADPYYCEQLARIVEPSGYAFNAGNYAKYLNEHGHHNYCLPSEKTAELIGLTVRQLRILEGLRSNKNDCYLVTDLLQYLERNDTFLRGFAPGANEIIEAFSCSFLRGIVFDRHDNKPGQTYTDFEGTIDEFLNKPISPWRNDPERIGDRCNNDKYKSLEILREPKSRIRLLDASVQLGLVGNRVSVRLIGNARFYALTGRPPFVSCISGANEL